MTDAQQSLFTLTKADIAATPAWTASTAVGGRYSVAGGAVSRGPTFMTPDAYKKYAAVLESGQAGLRVPSLTMSAADGGRRRGLFGRLFGRGGGGTATLEPETAKAADPKSINLTVEMKPTPVYDPLAFPQTKGKAASLSTLYKPTLLAVDVPKAPSPEKKGELPVVGCMPGCTHNHVHSFDYDYTKNFFDALNKRPGEFAEYNWMAANFAWLDEGSRGVVCDGDAQTPINLETGLAIKEDFQDKVFEVEYKDIDPKKQLKYNQKGQQFQLVMEGDKPEENRMTTQTISLFDKHIDSATLYGLQYHFHAPSEHSINGQLLDLEMHIVHALEPKHVSEKEEDKSQFTNGVLGFFFKAVPDDFEFQLQGLTDYHDRFLKKMLEAEKAGDKNEKIDLTKFVKLLNYNRRWTYPGSLTTAPFSEGILWNILEHVIPVRQSTLELFLDYRKVQQEKVFNEFANDEEKKATEAKLAIQPEQMKPFEDKKGETFFRVAACNRVVQDQGDRPVYHIDIDE